VLDVVAERLEPGLVLASSYRLERVVGEGGMGVVWAARETATGRDVALKFLRDGRESDPKNRERFVREARAAMAIAHPHIAKVHAVLETDVGTPFIVMELLRGESLRDRLQRRHALEPAETAQLMLPVVDAVAAAHANRIVHRDLKPENVFLVDGEHVRVLDFGIAKRIAIAGDTAAGSTATNLTSTGAILGTPLYMAPEQVFGDEDVDGRADVWALGIMLYECLAGRRPTDADGFGPIVKRITTDPIEPLDRAKPDVPKGLSRLVMRMLIRDRAARAPLTEVRDVLARIVAAANAGAPLEEASPSTQRLPPIGTTMGAKQASPAFTNKSTFREALPIAVGVTVVFIATVAFISIRTIRAKLDEAKRQASTSSADASVAAAPAEPPSAPPAGATAIPSWQDGLKSIDLARDALAARKGPECLKELDRHDGLFPDEASTKPSAVYADLRAQCLMVAGRCKEGKTLLRARLETMRAGTALDHAVEDEVAQYCEGREVTEREDLVRAIKKLNEVNYGQDAPKPTSAQCKQWQATVVALLPKVKSTGPADPVRSFEDDQGDRPAGRCYAKADDCASAIAVLRARAKKDQVVDESFADVFRITLEGTPCVAKLSSKP
jgi:eukaryotic-like serine/threonine-protein kinase